MIYAGIAVALVLVAFAIALKRGKFPSLNRVHMIGGERSYLRFYPNPGFKLYYHGPDFLYFSKHYGYRKGR